MQIEHSIEKLDRDFIDLEAAVGTLYRLEARYLERTSENQTISDLRKKIRTLLDYRVGKYHQTSVATKDAVTRDINAAEECRDKLFEIAKKYMVRKYSDIYDYSTINLVDEITQSAARSLITDAKWSANNRI